MRIKILKPKKLRSLSKRAVYGFLAVLILSSSYILWWRPNRAHAQTVFLTSTAATTWSVPGDWNSSSNTIEVIGGGGSGGSSGGGQFGGGGGGGGGAYAKITNASLAASTSVGINVGSAGQASYVCDSTANCSNSTDTDVIVAAAGGSSGSTVISGTGTVGANGGTVITGTGFAGGKGGNGGNSSGNNGGGGGGGGGAGGLNAAGTGASNGSGTTGGAGGQGDGTSGGSGGMSNGGFGINGTEWDLSHGSGGGGGGGAGGGNGVIGNPGAAGGNYGSGGGGAGGDGKSATNGVGGSGGTQGVIVITYTPVPTTYNQTSYQWFQNNPASVNPSTKLNGVAQSTPTALTSTGQAFRLRQLIKPSQSVTAGSQSFNEQYADLSTYGTCSAIPSGNWGNLSGGLSSSGPLFTGTGTDLNDAGTPWASVGNITALDSSYATVNVSSLSLSNTLKGNNFGFSIPGNATVSGIRARVIAHSGTSSNGDISKVVLVKAGVQGTTNRAGINNLDTGDAFYSFGSSSDLWGDTWTPADINNSGFGFAIRVEGGTANDTMSVDSFDMTVYYTIPSAMAYNDNPSLASGAAISYQAGTDPTDSGTYTAQTYQEADNFSASNTVAANTDGEWDLSIYDNGAPAGTTYCFRMVKSDGTPLDTYSQYPQITTYTPPSNSAPSSPSLTAPSSGATGISATPTFSFSDTDPDSDDIQFKVNLFQSDCSTSVTTYDMAGGQTGWTPAFNGSAGAGLTYTSTTAGSGVSFAPSSALSTGTIYCWSVSAKDPGGSNTTTTSSTRLFTTAAAGSSVTVQGGVTIQGGSTIQ